MSVVMYPSMTLRFQNLQDTDQKHNHHSEFLLSIHLKLVELGDGQNKHHNVQRDVQGDVAKSDTIQVQALPLVFTIPAIPEKVDRLAFAKAEDDEGQADEQVETLY